MEFEVLGPMRVRGGESEVRLSGRLQCVLLGVLLSRANRVVPADSLAEVMWGERPGDRDSPNLHVHVHRLRRMLPEPARLASAPGGYLLEVLPGELDAERFESMIGQAAEVRRADPGRAVELIRAALALWRGEPFGGADVPVLADEVRRLDERRLAATEELCAAELARGRYTEVVDELSEPIRQHPLRERLHCLLMAALYRSGQQGRALAVYRAVRRQLIDELGQEPGPELRRLEQQVLAGEPDDLDAAPPGRLVPAQLPHDVHGFTGRDAELSALDDALAGGAPVLISAVAGAGGVGKTALAVRWAHRVRDRFPDGQLYVDLRGFGPESPMSPDDALAGFLRELGVDSAAIPQDRDERVARFRTLVAGRRMLIVLDNARTAEQVRPLLPGGSAAFVLVTSRDSLAGLVARDGAQRVRLDRLGERDAAGLLARLIGDRVGAEPDATRALVARCARLPLALRIAAELVNARPHRHLADLVAELAEEQRALDVLDAAGDSHTAVRTVFSWSYQQLAPDAARLFRLLGLHPGHDVDAYALAALNGGDLGQTRTLIDILLRAHLLDETVASRYQMHDLLRAYAADLCRSTDSDGQRDSGLTRLGDYCLRTASIAIRTAYTYEPVSRSELPVVCTAIPDFAGRGQAIGWLNAERANLGGIAGHAARHGRPQTAVDLATELYLYFCLGGHHDEALAVYHHALVAAHELGDLVEEGHANRVLGMVYRRLGNLEESLEHMHRGYVCYRRVGHQHYVQTQLTHLGINCAWLGRYPEALDYLERALALCDELADGDRVRRGEALTYLGQLHAFSGDNEKALKYCIDALDLADVDNPRERLDALATLGIVYGQLGQHDQAQEHLERARLRARETGHQFIQAYVYPLGRVYWHRGRRQDAFDCVEHCLAIVLRNNERLIEAEVRTALGELHRLDGAYADALTQYHAALHHAQAIGRPHARAEALVGLGDTYHGLGDGTQAQAHWQRALELYQRLGVADADRIRARLAPAAAM